MRHLTVRHIGSAGPVPVAVTNVCQWTWMCAGAPQGPNIHGRAAGYREMAAVFKKALG
jgi:hypothetical protein